MEPGRCDSLFATLTSPVMRVPAAGGVAAAITKLDDTRQEISHRWPWFLPDGKHLLYTSRGQGIFVTAMDAPKIPTRLLEENSMALYASGFLLSTRGNTLFAHPFDARRREFTGAAATVVQSLQVELNSNRACVSVSENGLIAYHAGVGKSQLTWIDRRGSRLGVVGAPGFMRGIEISPDGNRVATILNEGSNRASIWVHDLARDVAARFASEDSFNMHMAWSPDSNRIAVGARRDGSFVIYAKEFDGTGNEELLFRWPTEALFGYWIPTGGLTLLLRNKKTGFDLYYVGNGQDPKPVLRGSADEMEGLVSPDGRWVLYCMRPTNPRAACSRFMSRIFPAGRTGVRSRGRGQTLYVGTGTRRRFFSPAAKRSWLPRYA
jgi:eukaryotic-like serine/threonine-protein kinase